MQFNSTGMWRPADPFTGLPETSEFNKLKRPHVPKVYSFHSYCYCSHKSYNDDDDNDDDDDDNNNSKFKQYLSNITGKHEIKELQKQTY